MLLASGAVFASSAQANDLYLGSVDFQPQPHEYSSLTATGAPVRASLDWDKALKPVGGDYCTAIAQNSYDWSLYDQRFRGLANAGVEVEHLILHGVPPCAGRHTCDLSDPGTRKCSPADAYLDDWQRFVTEAVRRYGPYGSQWTGYSSRFWIRLWNPWNEPDDPKKWNGESDARKRVRQYRDLLQVSDQAINTAPGTLERTVAGNVTYGKLNSRGYDFLLQLYRDFGGASYSDLAGMHVFTAEGPGEVIVRAKQAAGIPNVDRVAINAMGWTVSPVGMNEPGASPKCVSSQTVQADRLKTTFDRLVAEVPKVNWAMWYSAFDYNTSNRVCDKDTSDGNPENDAYGGFGLFEDRLHGYAKKESFCKFVRRAPVWDGGNLKPPAPGCPVT